MADRTWPVGPLLERMRCKTPKDLREHIGTDPYPYMESGLSDVLADRWATRCRLHPGQVWGWAWVDAGLSPLDRQYLAGGWRQAWLWNEDRTEIGEAA